MHPTMKKTLARSKTFESDLTKLEKRSQVNALFSLPMMKLFHLDFLFSVQQLFRR